MTSLPLLMLYSVGVLVELHDISLCALSLFRWTLDRILLPPEFARRFDWQERCCLLLQTPDAIWLLHFILIPSTFTKFHVRRMQCQYNAVKQILKKSSYDLPIADHVEMYWTPDPMLSVWCLNGNINDSQYFWSYTLLFHLKQHYPSNPLSND